MAPLAKKRRKELILDLSPKYKYNNPSKNFLSEPMLNYILKNASQEVYYKLIQVSKYFLVNQPPQIKMFESLYYSGDLDPSHPDRLRISKITGNRLWINTEALTWRRSHVSLKYFLHRCFRVNVRWLKLANQVLTYNELKLIMEGGNITSLHLDQCKFAHLNGKIVAVEDILEMAPLIDHFHYHPCEPYTFSSRKVARLPTFYCLDNIELKCITEEFSCKAFRKFLKKAPITSGLFNFASISPMYLRKFQSAVLKEVDPDIEINHFNETIFFGDHAYDIMEF